MTSQYLIPDLKRDEGLRLRAYRDTVGVWTVGYGHAHVAPDTVWTLAQADAALETDVLKAEVFLDRELPWWRTLSDLRQDVLVNQCFNMGIDTLLTFTTYLGLVKAADYAAAAEDVLTTKWAKQVGARATRLAEQMRTNVHAGTVDLPPVLPPYSSPPVQPPMPARPGSASSPTSRAPMVVVPSRSTIIGASAVGLATAGAAVTITTGAHVTVNLAPLIDQVLIPLLSSLLLGLVAWFIPWLTNSVIKWFHIKIDAQMAQTIENAMGHGINLAVHQLGVTLDANSTVAVKNQAVAVALNYAMMTAGTEMKALGITPESVSTRILARLPVVAATSTQ